MQARRTTSQYSEEGQCPWQNSDTLADWALQSFARAQDLVEQNTISGEEFDAAEARMKQSVAEVDNIRAVIAKKQVRAPFAGKLGIRRISVGQYLEKGSPIVALHSLDPVYVDFSLPQWCTHLLAIRATRDP